MTPSVVGAAKDEAKILSSSPARTATSINTTLGEYVEPEDVQDYDSLRRYFALDAALAAVDDVAKWLVGLAGALGAVGSGLGLTTVGAKLSSGDHVAIILLAISFILAVLGRMPLLISVNRRSVVSMKRTAGRLLGFRGTVIVLSASVFMAALITAAASS